MFEWPNRMWLLIAINSDVKKVSACYHIILVMISA